MTNSTSDASFCPAVDSLQAAKLGAESFLKRIAPKYLGVYLVDFNADRMSDVVAPVYFRDIVRRNSGSFTTSIRDYCTEFVAEESRAVFDEALDFQAVREKVGAGEKISLVYCRKDGLRVRLEVTPGSLGEEQNLFWWIFSVEASERAQEEVHLEARWCLVPGKDESSTLLSWNEGYQQLLEGISERREASWSEVLAALHPDDRNAAKQQLQKVLESKTKAVFDVSYRLIMRSGGYRCLRSIGQVHRDEVGRVVKVFGFSLDVTDQYQLLDTQNQLLDGLLREYSAVWLVNGRTLSLRLWRRNREESERHKLVNELERQKTYPEIVRAYAEECMLEADREDFLRKTDWRLVQEKLKTGEVYKVVHRRQEDGRSVCYQLSFAAADQAGDCPDFAIGCKNVNEVVQEDQKKSEALSKALASEASARQDLTAALHKLTDEKRILDTLSSDFTAVYYVELNTGAFEVLSLGEHTNVKSIADNKPTNFDDFVGAYCDKYVRPEDAVAVRQWFLCRNLKEQLKRQPRVTFHYRSLPNPLNQQYFEVQVIHMVTDDERFLVLMGLRHIDDIMEKEIAVQQKLKKALDESRLHNEIISAIGKCYQYVARIDIASNSYDEIATVADRYRLAGVSGSFHDLLEKTMLPRVAAAYQASVRQFADLSTLPARLKDDESVVMEYQLDDGNWNKLTFIVKKRSTTGVVTHVLMLIRSISNEKRNEESLFYMAEAARREAEVKSKFLANMSHDLRTPLNGLMGVVELARQHPEDAALQERSRDQISEKLKELTSLVNNVLDMSKLESGSFAEQSIPFDLTELLREANAKAEALAQQKGVKYLVDFDVSKLKHPMLIGNPVYLTRILSNVADNAVKFSRPGGEIRVWGTEVDVTDDVVTIEFGCEDHGIGMSEAFAKKAFDVFTQEAQTSRTSYGGTGLGLAIVKKLIERFNGTIELKTKQGAGTTVIFRLPLRIAQLAKPKALVDWEHMSVLGRRVLVVEDNELNMEVACCLLEDNGIEVARAHDGMEAVEKFRASAPGTFDAVFMDIMMPRMSGLEAARAIRTMDRPDAATVPIIAMTANSFAEDINRSRIAGMNEHLAKPLNEEVMVSALKKCLAARKVA